MTREELIRYIKANDHNYNYDQVRFAYYTDNELQLIYERIQRQKADEKRRKSNADRTKKRQ
ncbi:MAG: hypothetical protein AB1458_07025 [Bacteroidota bacterium]